MKNYHLLLFILFFSIWFQNKAESKIKYPDQSGIHKTDVQFWLTSPSTNILFRKQDSILQFGSASPSDPVIEVDSSQTFQTMDGFGNCLTDGSAMLLYRMSAKARANLLNELFAVDGNNIGISYLRISLGASDLSEQPFSYNDLLPGQSDFELKEFSIDPDRAALIPVLKEILSINPSIKILASPWSPPTWMKTNNHSKGVFQSVCQLFCAIYSGYEGGRNFH